MANVIIDDTYLSGIANAIRAKNGGSDTYTPAQMATAIGNLPTGGGSSNTIPYSLFNQSETTGTSTTNDLMFTFKGDIRRYAAVIHCVKNASSYSTSTNSTTTFIYTPECLKAYYDSGRSDGKVYIHYVTMQSGTSPNFTFGRVTSSTTSGPYIDLSAITGSYGVAETTTKYATIKNPINSSHYPLGNYTVAYSGNIMDFSG